MESIVIVGILFLVMLSAPFVGASIYCKRKKGDILFIKQEKVKDARYFGKSFAKTFEKNVDYRDNGAIYLSKNEEYICGDTLDHYPEYVEKLVMCLNKDYEFDRRVKEYNKEIYGAYNIINPNVDVKVRAAYAKKSMVLGKGTKVERWVDAEETLAIYDECRLGVSASAGKRMSIGKCCEFRRLYAPEILIGQYPQNYKDSMEGRSANIFKSAKELSVIRNVKHITAEYVNELGEVDAVVLTKHAVDLLENIILRGDICSHKGIRICDGAVVCGNVFAEEDIHIGRNAVVLGNVFTQGSVYVEEGAMIGQKGKISSIIARENITFEKNIAVYGYVSCENSGKVLASNYDLEIKQYIMLDCQKPVTEIVFDDLVAYEAIDAQGYRKEEGLEKVHIAVNAKEIRKSLFFGCKSLKKVILPETIEQIGPYAFADCEALSDITSLSNMPLKSIGTSAFENCMLLEEIQFPKELESIGGAAFGNCTALKKVKFQRGCKLKTIGAHCFRGCENLEEIELPNEVEEVGLSAFRDCSSLKLISIPTGCVRQPGILELKEKGNVEIIIRMMEI